MIPQEKGPERLLHELVEVKESKEPYETVLPNISDTVLVAQDDGALTFIGPSMGVFFGYSVEGVKAHAKL